MATDQLAVRTKPIHLALGAVLVLVMLAVAGGMVFSFFAALFGPVWGFLVGVVGFVLGLAGYLYSDRCFIPACPRGLAGITGSLAVWRRPLDIAARTAVAVAFLAIATLALSARFDGQLSDAAGPVFAPREKYGMTSHGKETPISKLRYWTIGTSTSLTWHALGLFFALVALHGLVLGEPLRPWQPRPRTQKSAAADVHRGSRAKLERG